MITTKITGFFRNFRQNRILRKTQKAHLTGILQDNKRVQVALPATTAVVNSLRLQLGNITYRNNNNQVEHVYDEVALKYIDKLHEISPERAMDMANRLKINVNTPDDYRLPHDWDYVMNIYENDYHFIEENSFSYDSLGQIEALHRAKDEISDNDEFAKYKLLTARLIYPFLEMRKEYPEQVNEILDNKKYKELFRCETGKVPYSNKMKKFAEFIKTDSATMQDTLKMFDKAKRYYPTNMNSSCNLSEALKYAKMMTQKPEAVREIMGNYPEMAPELLEVLLKNSDNPYLLEDFKIYKEIINPFKIREYENVNDFTRSHYFSVPVEKGVLNDLDDFLKSGFLTELNDILAEKRNYSDSNNRYKEAIARDLRVWYHRENSENSNQHEYNLYDWLGKVKDKSPYDEANKKDYLRNILKNDRKTFLRLVKDDILFLYSNKEVKRIAQLYQKYPDKKITDEMIRQYLDTDASVAEAFLN